MTYYNIFINGQGQTIRSIFYSLAVCLLLMPFQLFGQTNITNANLKVPYGGQVNTWNGNFFYDRADIQLPAVGEDILIQFSYNSNRNSDDSGYGKGWTMHYNLFYSADGLGNITIEKKDGEKHVFNWTGTTYLSPPGNFERLRQYLPGQYRLVTREGMRYYFDDPAHMKLTRMVDRKGNTMTFNYNGSGELIQISSSCGTSLTLTWTGGHLTQISDTNEIPTRNYTYQYDGSNRLIQYTDPTGTSESYAYDANDRIVGLANKNGNALTITYNAFGAVQSLTSPLTSQTLSYNFATLTTTLTESVGAGTLTSAYIYNSNKQLIQRVGYCCGNNTQYVYDANNNVTQKTDANGNITTYTYDSRGLLLSKTDALGNSKSYTYNLTTNQLSASTDKNGNVRSYVYDALGNLLQLTQPTGFNESYTYNPDGTKASYTDGNGNVYTYSYDACGQVIMVNKPLGSTTTYSYNNRGELLSETNPNGCSTSYTYDDLSRLTSITDPLGNTISYAYDAIGNIISETDKNGNTTTYTYDALHRKTSVNGPLGVTSSKTYNQKNLTSVTDPNGNMYTFTYNGLNLLSQQTDPEGGTALFTYDAKGNRMSRTDPNGNLTMYEYDAIDQQIKITNALNGISNLVYDPNGNLISVTDPLGNTTTTTYDGLDRQLVVSDAAGGTTSYVYDNNNNQIQETDANGNSRTYTYDALDRLVSVTDALSNTINYTYDPTGNAISYTDANGNATTHTFDCLNQKLSSTNAAGESTTFTYDPNSNKVNITQPNGNTIGHTYDALDRVTSIIDNINVISTFTYDDNNNALTHIDANGNGITLSYDGLNRVVTRADGLGQLNTFIYDGNSNMVGETDRNGNTTLFEYDALNRRTKTTDALGNITLRAFDAMGNLTQLTDANNNVTTYSYDNLYRLVTEAYADGTTKTYSYDAVGNRVNRTDNKGVNTNYMYDAINRLTTRDYPGSNDDVFTYDNGGRMLTANNANALINYSYDQANRLLTETNNGLTTAYAYDVANGKRILTYPDGRTIEENYDARRRLTVIKDGVTNLATFAYDPGNRLTQQSYQNGTNASYMYNANNRTSQLIHTNAGTIANFEYAYDGEDNKLYSRHNHKTDFSEEYVYDALDRLSHFKKGTLVGSSIPAPTTQTQYSMDGVGNRTTIDVDGVVTTYTRNNMNEYTQINGPASVNPNNDANGNLTSDGMHSYQYDTENRLIQVDDDIFYFYDALGRRVRKVADGFVTNFFFDGPRVIMQRVENPNCPYDIDLAGVSSNLIKTHTAANTIKSTEDVLNNSDIVYSASDTVTLNTGFFVEAGSVFEAETDGCLPGNDTPEITTFVYGTWIDDVLNLKRNGTHYYYHHDAGGSVIALTDAFANIVERYDYDAFGAVQVYDATFNALAASTVDNPYLYKGRRVDTETGLYYNRARHYDSTTGRFIQRDPLGYIDGMNLYEYAKSSPINNLDFLGTNSSKPVTKPSVKDGWRYDPGSGRWEKDADDFWKDDLTDDERATGKSEYERGCVGVVSCKMEVDSEDFGNSQCYESEATALQKSKTKVCGNCETVSIFAVRYWDKHKATRVPNADGTYPVDASEIYEHRPGGGWVNFDFGYRQADGSYIHANHAQPGMKVKISPSSKEFDNGYAGFNTVLYCIRCTPCKQAEEECPGEEGEGAEGSGSGQGQGQGQGQN